jgi:phosphoglycolate phosphatase
MNAQTKNIVFDWNGTLLDDMQAMFDCQNILMEQLGRQPITMDYFRTHYEVPFEKLYANLGLTKDEIDFAIHLDRHVFHDHYEPMAAKAFLRAGATETLGYARQHGLTALILSNHIVDPIRTQLRRLKIEHFFDDVLAYACRDTQFKDMTKGERLRRFMNDRGMTPKNTMIVGDSIEEIHIGCTQGFITVAITGGCASEERLRAENPDYLIHSLHELQSVLKEQGFVS